MPVEITGLNEFRADLRRSVVERPIEVTKLLRVVGLELSRRTGTKAPRGSRADDKHPGALSESYRPRISGASGRIVSRAPYGGGAEWGTRGKWKGFLKYGGRGRFAWKTVEESAEWIVQAVQKGLADIATAHGWLRE